MAPPGLHCTLCCCHLSAVSICHLHRRMPSTYMTVDNSRLTTIAAAAAAARVASAADSIDGMSSQASRLAQPPVYAMRPVLKSSKGLWQFLHALLMLLSFGVMLPLGMMAARHKWIFGSNEETVSTVLQPKRITSLTAGQRSSSASITAPLTKPRMCML